MHSTYRRFVIHQWMDAWGESDLRRNEIGKVRRQIRSVTATQATTCSTVHASTHSRMLAHSGAALHSSAGRRWFACAANGAPGRFPARRLHRACDALARFAPPAVLSPPLPSFARCLRRC